MQYYIKRKKLLNNEFSFDLDDLRRYFFQTYKYFDNRELFDVAFKGVWGVESFSNNQYQVYPPSMAPTPEVFFINQLESDNIYPIHKNYIYYSVEELFTLIEILYKHIGFYDFGNDKFEKREHQEEFTTLINNLLKRYKNGYYLDEKLGFIMEQSNEAVNALLQTDVPKTINEGVMEQLQTSVKMFYRFNSNEESKKKAINILADILEPLRENLKELLNNEYEVNKNSHDKLIFEVVNQFNIRHNNQKQITGYSREIWYDWMMQYYTSVIITYYRLIENKGYIRGS